MTIPEPTGWFDAMQFTKDDIMRAIEMVVMGVLGLVVLLLVVRPLVRRIVTPEEPKAWRRQAGRASSFPERSARIAASDVDPSKAGEPSVAAKMIDIAQIQGQVHAQSVQKVGELADKNPEETVAIIRHWLHEMPAA